MQTQLTQAEWKIMLALWDKHPQTMMELTHTLEPDTGWSKYTVTTMLKRMIAKGTVSVDESGPVRTYAPAIAKAQVAREQTQTLLSRMFQGKASLLVSNLVEQGEMTEAERTEIVEILQNAAKNGDNRE